jgi:hypothetical protein
MAETLALFRIRRNSVIRRPTLMRKVTVVFERYAAAEMHNIVQTLFDDHNVASTGQTEWYPVAFFLKDENGEVLGGLLGNLRTFSPGNRDCPQ